ncbi:gluconokinase [Rubritalea squalenifaciens DSM 18772]|uniref:Gluconokinase n=2 Tax=Rubritalea TaxID=361050 RepID=A0A1M6B990_9BACT|nr:gluconokinase [Rubritalea squalenifaciens DSM 18772]
MGVSGCGKSTVGSLLAAKLGGKFFDGDDYHPQANIDKMASGQPLNDDDRQGWLESLRDLITSEAQAGRTAVIACSALKKKYRDLLREAGAEVSFIHLHGSRELLLERLTDRAAEGNHFMPATLLDSQLDTLEYPQGEPFTHILNISHSPASLADEAANQL